MSEIKFTPGPWEVKGYGDGIYPAGGNYPIICSMTTPSGMIENHAANAKLIAAAPELLKELINLVTCWDNDTFQDVDIEYAKEAIKKATT